MVDTIAAISTGLSNSGISIIRVSGPETFQVMDRIFRGKKFGKKLSEQKTHTIHYGWITDGEEIVDEVLVSVMRAPNTYTAEDVAEINCHGGSLVTKKVLRTVLKAGARLAEAGEFTKRAFLNGRIDLSKAEAVMEVIRAKSDLALKNSMAQLQGNVLKEISELREKMIHHTAFIEAALDDPEHISLEGFTNELKASIIEIRERLSRLISSAENGRMLKEGIRTVILGKPNVGKSSLMNLFAGEERAIVTDIAGTTRDTIEETVTVRGIALSLIDTAGIRSTEDVVEKIGVEKAKRAAQDADLILYLADATSEITEDEKEILALISNKKSIILLNKIDLCKIPDTSVLEELTGQKVLCISAKEEEGLDALYDTIEKMFFQKELSYNEDLYITGERQKQSLQDAYDAMGKVLDSIEAEMPEDFYSIDLMQGYESLGEITGESVDEDLVNTIFREFCMGK
ncbi:MAG: tRNA uridine-5-carboxymethylaminomethyl(34) synthesis GTPase MnmE [Lachnospiraceae bacterium]|nr:tRNA uridine-5-carboxymethylaminomethyl(34) synthesis GTPase MnmE [Lachnospiraceae bacterium]